MVRAEERIKALELEEETSHISIKSSLDNIQRIHNKAKIIQWEKKQVVGQAMFRMEATLCKLNHEICYAKITKFTI